MRAISLWQPWASLVALGLKRYETRSWSTAYRGLVAIHAAKLPAYQYLVFHEEPFKTALKPFIKTPEDIPYGAALAVVRLLDVVPTDSIANQIRNDDEYFFGDYSAGRFAWKLELVERFQVPISWRGSQGFFDIKIPKYERQARETETFRSKGSTG